MLDNLKKIVGTVAPFLGSMLGGPFGGSVGALLGKVLLGDENASESAIESAIGRATPEQLVKIKQIDAEYKTKMAQLGIDEQKIHALDRDSARRRETKTKDKVPAILAIFLTVGFFSILGCLMFYPIEKATAQIIDIMLGSLGTAWVAIIQYYFGSSSGSREKTSLLSKQ